MSFTCSEDDGLSHPYSLVNNSEEAIYVSSCGYVEKGNFLTYGYVRNCTEWTFEYIQPGESYESTCLPPSSVAPYREMQILILRESTLRDCSERDLIENDVHDKRYVLTYEELEAMNFTIDYKGE